jgi:hypothetical protein
MSFKQVEYLVYWIHKMQLVDTKVPIPSSKSLLFEEDLGDLASHVQMSKARKKCPGLMLLGLLCRSR